MFKKFGLILFITASFANISFSIDIEAPLADNQDEPQNYSKVYSNARVEATQYLNEAWVAVERMIDKKNQQALEKVFADLDINMGKAFGAFKDAVPLMYEDVFRNAHIVMTKHINETWEAIEGIFTRSGNIQQKLEEKFTQLEINITSIYVAVSQEITGRFS